MRIAIITGASSGLGREYARWADRQGSFDQIWALARRAERLQELADELACPVRSVCLNLGDPKSARELARLLAEAAADSQDGLSVGLLVNAAGLGKFGTCDDLTLDEVDAMVDVNCRALVELTQVALAYMGRGSRIIEFSSSASFQPLPGLNVYAASKAFVRSYTRALRFELRGRGIYATAVCPLWVRTEFIDVARETANGQTVRHPFPVLNARHVVRWSMLVNSLNYPVACCCVTGLIMRLADKILPAPVVMWAWEGLRRI